MPNLWSDVAVDVAATDELVQQLVTTAAAVSEVVGILEGDGPVIAEDWGGPHRDAFDGDRAGLVEAGRTLAESLLRIAAQAVALLAAGQGEQRLRARLRDELEPAGRCQPERPC